MAVSGKSKKELIEEISALRSRLKELEYSKAEKELRESEQKLQAIFDQTFQFIGLMKTDGILIEANRTALKFAGIEESDVLNKPFWETPWWTHSPELQDQLREAVSKAATGQFIRFEATHPAADGSIHYIDFSLKPVKDEKGNVVWLIPEGRDITEHKQAEEALRQSQERFRTIIETAQDSIFIKDHTLRYTHVNPTMERLFGIPAQKLIGCTDDDLFGKEAGEHIREIDSRVLEGQIIEEEHTKPIEGVPFTFHVIKVPIRDSAGKIVGLCGIARNITERKQMEELLRKAHDELEVKVQGRTAELQQANKILKAEITNRKKAEEALGESEAKYRMLFENTSMPVSFWSLNDGRDDWRLLSINTEAARKIGGAPEEVIGNTIDEVFSDPDAADKARKVFKEVLESGKGYESEDGIEMLNGVKTWFRSDIRPVKDENGQIIAIQALSEDITERKRLEEAYRSLVDNSLQGLAIVQDGRMVFLNKAFSSTTGYTEQELLAASPEQLQSLVHSEDRELVWTRHRDRLAGKPVSPRYEFRWIRKDGSISWVEIHASEIEYRGRPAIQAAYIDITKRKQMEEALRVSEEKYYTLFHQSAQPMLLCNLETLEMEEFNDSAHNSLGYTREEFEKLKITDYEIIESPEETKAHVQKIIKNGSDIFETQNRTKSGEIRDVLVNVKVIELHDKLYSMAIVTDTTDRKRAEQALKESEEKFRTLAEQTPNMIYINKKGRVVYANKKCEEVMGYKKEEFYSPDFDFMTLIAPDSVGLVKENFARYLRGEEIRPYDFAIINGKGEKIEAINTTKLIQYEGEMSVLGIITDITERKQAEDKLLDHQEKLKSLASQLSVIEERERRRLAAELHDQIGQSLVMSKMKLDSLRESLSTGVSTEILEDVCGCLKQVIQDTRTLTFDLSYPILYELGFETAVAEWLDEQIREKHGIQTEFQDDGLPKPLDDDIRALLFRNVRELLINIVKHAKARKVKVSVCRVDEHIHVSVEDDGVGFDPVEVTSTAAQKAKFGLFSIRERLEQLAGHFEIESEPGRGSKIMMTAPLKVEQSTEGVEV